MLLAISSSSGSSSSSFFLKEFSNFCLTVSRNFFFAVLLDILLTYNKKDFLQFLVRESKTQQAVNYDKDNHKEKWMNL